MFDKVDAVFNNLVTSIGPIDRKNHLINLKKAIKNHENDLYKAIKLDLNKSEYEAYLSEVGLVYEELTFFIKKCIKLSRPKKVSSCIAQFPSSAYIYHEPYGRVLIISPWNYPIQLALIPLVGAIGSGNSAIVKPSELTPNVSNVLKTIINEALPSNICEVILGDKDVSNHLSLLKFDKIFFTGSPRVGQIIYENASKNMVPVVLELGGKSPVIVTDSNNLKLAAKRLVFAKWLNAGQTCVAPDYLFIHENDYLKFTEYLTYYINKYVMYNIENDLFPKIITKNHYNRLIDMIESDKVINKYYKDDVNNILGPVLINEDSFDSKVMSEEIFGPILPIIKYNDINKVMDYIKQNPKPLALYVFSDNKQKINMILNDLSYGSACINDAVVQITVPKLPFGGVGNSGIGAYHGMESFNCFTHKKSVLNRKKYLDLELRYPPYNKKTTLLKKILK